MNMSASNIWDRFSEHYDIGIATPNIYKDLQKKAINALNPCQTVLDIGCGTGNLTLHFLKRGKEVHSCDNSKGMLAKTKEKIAKHGFKDKLNVYLQNAEKLGFKSNLFEGAALLNVLFYVKDPEKVLIEAFRVLKPGGIFVVSGPRRHQNVDTIIKSAMKDYKRLGLLKTKKEHRQAKCGISESTR